MGILSFYFDESFHDRKITQKKGKVNIHNADASDSYVAVFIGRDTDIFNELEKEYSYFEEIQKKIYGLSGEQELKGTTLGKKNFKYGVSSFNNNAFDFYKEYFSIITENMYIQINIISKTAQIVKTIFSDVNISRVTDNRTEFLYSVAKSLNNYRFNSILIRLFDERGHLNSRKLVYEFLKNFKLITKSSISSTKKRYEREALNKLIFILNEVKEELNTSSDYSMDYEYIFNAFDSYVIKHSLNCNHIDLYIDNEINTFEMATKNQKYRSVKSCDSEEYLGIRISDILSNFIGRMIKAISEDLKEPVINNTSDVEAYDFKTKKLLSKEWFKLNEKQFNLYRVINDVFGKRNTAILASYYFDYALLFKGIMNYFGEYESFQDYQRYSFEEHAEYFNTYSCKLIADQYALLQPMNHNVNKLTSFRVGL